MKSWMPLYDNSDAFSDFLRMQGIEQAARKAGLKISPQHTIVPHVSDLLYFSVAFEVYVLIVY